MRTKKNIFYSTFVGLRVEVIKSTQRNLIGMSGRVVDETKNTIIIERGGRELKIPKVSCVFRFTLDNGERVDIEGKKIAFRPHERPKKV